MSQMLDMQEFFGNVMPGEVEDSSEADGLLRFVTEKGDEYLIAPNQLEPLLKKLIWNDLRVVGTVCQGEFNQPSIFITKATPMELFYDNQEDTNDFEAIESFPRYSSEFTADPDGIYAA